MKSLHLTLLIFCHLLLAAVVLHFSTFAAASPLLPTALTASAPVKEAPAEEAAKREPLASPAEPVKPQASQPESKLEAKAAVVAAVAAVAEPAGGPQAVQSSPVEGAAKLAPKKVEPAKPEAQPEKAAAPAAVVVVEPVLTERNAPVVEPAAPVAPVAPKQASPVAEPAVDASKQLEAKKAAVAAEAVERKTKKEEADEPVVVEARKVESAPSLMIPVPAALTAEKPAGEAAPVASQLEQRSAVVVAEEAKKSVVAVDTPPAAQMKSAESEPKKSPLQARSEPAAAPTTSSAASEQPVAATKPEPLVVKGGLGPLHLLASTLCSYQPEQLAAEEAVQELYKRRALVRKTLFEFMNLKFTHLDKISSRLNSGLPATPIKTSSGVLTSHGWPVVGKCTAHDLRLMGEAAWCECEPGDAHCAPASPPTGAIAPALDSSAAVAVSQQQQVAAAKEEEPPAPITSNRHLARSSASARALDRSPAPVASPNSPLSDQQSAVVSKLVHVSGMKDAPIVEGSSLAASLNLTAQQLAVLQANATTRECRRNALRYTKALFIHLAEDQQSASETWPRLYALMAGDECARKRMIDIVAALSEFRGDTTSIRRDNLEFAFAMDDLRSKVLENEVHVPLTFDRQFIEVEQFLQQSVQLMLANIDPQRAKITKARYRSLMSGPSAADDQCIELHQRLLARTYPTDCNPTQFGQLPDVLRMTASSLELWSIERELSKRAPAVKPLECASYVSHHHHLYHGQQASRSQLEPAAYQESVDECIANLVKA